MIEGVEMEALTGASVAALTIYDMCKAVNREMVIDETRLLKKTGGMRGDYEFDENGHWDNKMGSLGVTCEN